MADTERRSPFDVPFFAFLVLTLLSGGLCYWRGKAVFLQGVDAAWDMMIQVLPKIIGALFMAGFIQVLVPKEVVVRWIGGEAGAKGIAIACLAGIITPGGPIMSFPLIAALNEMGADISALVAYLLSWELMGLQRILIWEIPLMGVKFTALRAITSFFLPALAGLIAQRIAKRV